MESIIKDYFLADCSRTLTSLPEKKKHATGPAGRLPEPGEPNDPGNHSRYVEVVNYMYRFATTLG